MNNESLIYRRDKHFDFEPLEVKNWSANGQYVTYFFNSMSILFPEGERFFIHSVRHYLPVIEEQKEKTENPEKKQDIENLLTNVKGFIGQEAMHGREHQRYNDSLKQFYDVQTLEIEVKQYIDFGKKLLSPLAQLRTTIALEHFTAIMANSILSNPELVKSNNKTIESLWKWHAAEETEHKAVAYDVYLAVAPKTKREYLKRIFAMQRTTLLFWIHVWSNFFFFAKSDKNSTNWKEWKALMAHLFGKNGLVRMCYKDYFAYYKPSFHPWQQANRNLLEQWKKSNEDPEKVHQKAIFEVMHHPV